MNVHTDTAGYAGPGIIQRGREAVSDLWADKARLRRILMTWGVGIVVVVSLTLYLTGGRYVTNDDAYVSAQKLAVSTDVSGLVKDVDVKEGDHVKAGQVLFRCRQQVQTSDPAIRRIRTTLHQAARFKAIDQPSNGDRLDFADRCHLVLRET